MSAIIAGVPGKPARMAAETAMSFKPSVSPKATVSTVVGGLLLAVAPDQAEALWECLKDHGGHAALVGEVTGQAPGRIRLEP